jgi:hypothetical protein
VRARLGNDFLSGLRQRTDGNLISHGSGGHKKTGLAAKHLRSASFKQVDSRILAVNIVANFGSSHRSAHFLCRASNRVGAQIDNASHLQNLPEFQRFNIKTQTKIKAPTSAPHPYSLL